MWEENEERMGVSVRSCLVPHSVLFEMRWVGGLSTQPLDASHPTFCRRRVAMAIQQYDWCVMAKKRRTERRRYVLWRASLSGGAMEHKHLQEADLYQ